MADTYEAQLARNLGGIDQTLKILKFAVQTNGAGGALQSLASKGLLPSGLVFVVSIADTRRPHRRQQSARGPHQRGRRSAISTTTATTPATRLS